MKRLKKILYYSPLYLLVFLLTTRTAQAISIIDIGGGASVGAAIGTFLGVPWLGAIIGAVLGGILSFFGVGIADLAKDIVTVLFQWAFTLIAAILGAIASVFFAIAGGLVNYAITLSQSLAESEVVILGHDIVLAVANLGLVAGIIVIAFMVMFRRANVGPLLTRFVAAALLINFSFFIITQIFLAPVDALTSVLEQAANFSPLTFAKIFRPQESFVSELFRSPASGVQVPEEWFTDIAVGFAGLLFVVSFLFIGTITLFAFAAMLFVRYAALGLLIVIVPLVWISWIFPNLKIPGGNPWSQWWSQFTKWLLFAPIGMFFLFLSVRAVNSNVLTTDVEGTDAATQGLAAVGDMLIITGLLLGGLIVANKMSITGSSYAMAVAKKGGNWAKARGRVMAIGAISAPLRTEKGKKFTEKAQEAGVKGGRPLRWATAPVRVAGRQMNVLGAAGQRAVKKEAEAGIKVFQDDMVRLAQAVPSLSGGELVEALDTLRKKKLLHLIPQESGGVSRLIGNPGLEKLYKRLGRGGDYEDLEKAVVLNREILEAKTEEARKEAVAKFMKTFSAKDISNIEGKIFGQKAAYGLKEDMHKAIRGALNEEVFENYPGAIVKIRPKLKYDDLIGFQDDVDDFIKRYEDRIGMDPGVKGLGAKVKDKMANIGIKDPARAHLRQALYNASRNFGSSLWGAYEGGEGGTGGGGDAGGGTTT